MNLRTTKNFFLSILACLIFFLILEIIFTLFFIYHSNYHGLIGKFFEKDNNNKSIINYKIKVNKYTDKMEPGIYKINNLEIKVNSKGFRGEEFDIKNEKKCRIISLGGSTTLGIQSDRSYPSIVEEKLKKNKIDCEVLNFGISAKSLNFIENLLVTEVMNYSPNIITIMSNRNATMYDSYGNSSYSPDIISNNFQYYLYKINKFCFSNIMTFRFLELALKRSISWFIKKEDKIVNPYDPTIFHNKNYFTKKYLNQMTNIVNFSYKNGVKVVLIKQAYFIDPKYQQTLRLLSKKEIVNKLLKNHKNDNSQQSDLFWMHTNAILNNTLDEIKTNNPDVIIVDPTEELYKYNKDVNFTDDGLHLNSNGNEIVADKIVKSIKKLFN